MSLSTTRKLFWISIAVTVLGSCVLAGAVPRSSVDGTGSVSSADQGGAAVAGILILIAIVLMVVAWVGALIRTAQFGRWGWFVSIFLLGSLALLAYVIAGPDSPAMPSVSYLPPLPPSSYAPPPSAYPAPPQTYGAPPYAAPPPAPYAPPAPYVPPSAPSYEPPDAPHYQ